MQKKFSVLLIILTTALFIIWFFSNRTLKNKKLNTQFNLQEQFIPDKIKIYQDNESCSLVKKDSKWLVGTSDEAKGQWVNFMISKLYLLSMDYPASQYETGKLKDTLVHSGRTIELYQKNKKIYSLVFMEYKGKNIALNRKEKPYYIIIAGNQAISLDKLIPAKAALWKKNMLIDLGQDDIMKVCITYPDNLEQSFCLQKGQNKKLTLYNNQDKSLKHTDKLQTEDYMKFFRGITYLPFDNKNYSINALPLFILSVTRHDSVKNNYEGHQLIQVKGHQEDNNFYGIVLNSEDTVLVKYEAIDPVLVEKEYFLKK
jgi:hypothetical protein